MGSSATPLRSAWLASIPTFGHAPAWRLPPLRHPLCLAGVHLGHSGPGPQSWASAGQSVRQHLDHGPAVLVVVAGLMLSPSLPTAGCRAGWLEPAGYDGPGSGRHGGRPDRRRGLSSGPGCRPRQDGVQPGSCSPGLPVTWGPGPGELRAQLLRPLLGMLSLFSLYALHQLSGNRQLALFFVLFTSSSCWPALPP